jgi:uncharacterized repeat protein (TIGR03803 family)
VNSCMRHLLLLLALALSWMLIAHSGAQTLTTLHSFAPIDYNTVNRDGTSPRAGLILSGNTMYGTAVQGGSFGNGTVFRINANGSGFTNLHSFTSVSGNNITNTDGADPYAGLIVSGNMLFGTASRGGAWGNGTVFALRTDGGGFRILHNFAATSNNGSFDFTNNEGARPEGLILSGDTLYGTASGGGAAGTGTAFKLSTNGTGFTTLHNFAAVNGFRPANADGAYPCGALILSGNTLFGTATGGGSWGNGTVFTVNTDGTGFAVLHNFAAGVITNGQLLNTEGTEPFGSLVLSADTMYGTAYNGGSAVSGTVFELSTNGTGFTVLHSFSGSDGAGPYAGLVLSGNSLYGTTTVGGIWGNGTVFSLHTDGSGFVTLHSFSSTAYSRANMDGANPYAGVIISDHTLYGTANAGGTSGTGTIFNISLLPQLTILPALPFMVLTWPTNITGFSLQSATNLGSGGVWIPVFPGPVIIGNQNVVIDTVSGDQNFYRLIQ